MIITRNNQWVAWNRCCSVSFCFTLLWVGVKVYLSVDVLSNAATHMPSVAFFLTNNGSQPKDTQAQVWGSAAAHPHCPFMFLSFQRPPADGSVNSAWFTALLWAHTCNTELSFYQQPPCCLLKNTKRQTNQFHTWYPGKTFSSVWAETSLFGGEKAFPMLPQPCEFTFARS